MTTRPIIFSAPMVRALLAGRKTQTRRLAWQSDPDPQADDWPTIWQRVKPGDRLWVKESAWIYPRPSDRIEIAYVADCELGETRDYKLKRKTPSIHMPRWASRLTLVVTAARIERLQDISEEDALAEGVKFELAFPPFFYVPDIIPHSITHVGVEEGGERKAARSFGKLWNHVHGAPGSWDANPEVVAITFCVHHCNTDAMERAA